MGFLDGLLGALGGIANAIISAIVFIFQLIVQVFEFIWQVIGIVAGYMVDVFKSIGAFFRHVWDVFHKFILPRIWRGIKALPGWIESHLKTLLKWLKIAQKKFDELYRLYVRPFLILIQHIRQFLQILKLLHVKFAVELDKILATVQRDVNGVFQQIRGILNTTIDLLNILTDPTKLLRRPTLVLSLRRTINALIRQVTGMPPGWYFPSPHKNAPHGTGFLPANFNPADPTQNPPPSYYLTLDDGVPSYDFLGEGEVIGDGAVDGVGALDFFDGEAWLQSDCPDLDGCLLEAQQRALAVQ